MTSPVNMQTTPDSPLQENIKSKSKNTFSFTKHILQTPQTGSKHAIKKASVLSPHQKARSKTVRELTRTAQREHKLAVRTLGLTAFENLEIEPSLEKSITKLINTCKKETEEFNNFYNFVLTFTYDFENLLKEQNLEKLLLLSETMHSLSEITGSRLSLANIEDIKSHLQKYKQKLDNKCFENLHLAEYDPLMQEINEIQEIENERPLTKYEKIKKQLFQPVLMYIEKNNHIEQEYKNAMLYLPNEAEIEQLKAIAAKLKFVSSSLLS